MQPTVTATVPPVANPALLTTLREAQTLTIVDSWWVYGPIQEVSMLFELRRTGDTFVGTGSYAATSYYGPKSATTRSIAIPVATIMDFFAVVADAPLREGAVNPKMLASDYYPKLRIAAVTPAGTVSFASESQGIEHVPWQASIDGKSYVVDTPHPANALKLIDPYLQRDQTIDSLTVAIDATIAARPTPTPFTPPQCRTPTSGQPGTPVASLPSPDPAAAHVAPGAQPRVGETINLARYFGLTVSTFLSAGGNFAPLSLSDAGHVAPIVAALDRESIVLAAPSGRSPDDTILFTLDVGGKPASFGYSAQLGVVSFGVAGTSYATPAPPSFQQLWAQLICTRPR